MNIIQHSYKYYLKTIYAIVFINILFPITANANPLVIGGVYGKHGVVELFFFIPTVIFEFWIVAKILKVPNKKKFFGQVVIIHLLSYPITVIAGAVIWVFAEIIPITLEYYCYKILFKKLNKKTVRHFAPTNKQIWMACFIANIASFFMGVTSTIFINDIYGTNHVAMAKQVRAKSDIMSLSTALEMYKLDNKILPSTEQGLKAIIFIPKTGTIPTNWYKEGYLGKKVIPKDPWGNDYIYICPGEHGEFDMKSFGSDGKLGGKGKNKDINSWEIE